MKRNPRHEQFGRLVALLGDATEAARQTGYKDGPGLSVTAHKLMQKPQVQTVIADERARLANGQQITNDEIIEGLAEIAKDKNNAAAARVSAYRTLAEVRGMLKAPETSLPDALSSMLEAVARGAQRQIEQRTQPVIEAPFREVAETTT